LNFFARTAAKRIVAAVSVAYPKATVTENVAGKPKKGSFEVALGNDMLFSKLDTYGPAKNRDHLANPEKVLEELLKQYPKVRYVHLLDHGFGSRKKSKQLNPFPFLTPFLRNKETQSPPNHPSDANNKTYWARIVGTRAANGQSNDVDRRILRFFIGTATRCRF
jgi:hypothetical protein